jgi:hypothetical protein
MQGLSDRMAMALGLVGPDYDYGAGGAYNKRTGHYGDAGKLPNHPTFSNQSNYAGGPGLAGGVWDTITTRDGKIVERYSPSTDMVNAGTTVGLAQYMKDVEPGVILGNPVQPKQTKGNKK